MKTVLTLFALMVVLPFSLHAQDEDVLHPHGGGKMGSGSSSSSSTPIMLGIEGGINYNMFSQTITGLLPNSRNEVFKSGSGFSPFFGAFIDIGLSHNFGIQVKLAYDQKKFGNTQDAIIDCEKQGGLVIDAPITAEYSNTVSYLDLTPQLRWNITSDFFALIGPTAHFTMGKGSQTSTETINSDGDCYFYINTPQQSKTFQYSSDSVNVTSFRIGAQIDLGYKFLIAPSMFLVPKVGFQYMFTTLTEDNASIETSKPLSVGYRDITLTDRMLHSLQFSLGLWFQL